jgi:hypothetical protein
MGSKSSSAAPPDPRLIEGQLKSMGVQDAMIQQIMQNTADTAPLQKEALQFGLDTSKSAYDQSQADRGWMLGRRGELSTLQDTQVKDAATFNTEDKANELAGKATTDVNQAFANAQGQNGRALARMGVNPNSGKSLAIGNQTAIAQAAALAGAATGARTSARVEGRALTDRATNTLAGYPSMATTATGAGAGFGSNGITVANTGLAGLNSGSLSAATVAGQEGANAANMYGTMGNYKNQADQVAASNSPWATIIGAGAKIGAAYAGKVG